MSLPVSMKQGQATLSAWKLGKISDPPWFLTGPNDENGILIEKEHSRRESMGLTGCIRG